jgi:hypothetical protein
MRHALAPAALILALQPPAAWAQADRDPYSGAPLPPRRHEAPSPVTDHFYIRGTWYVPQVRTNLRIDPSGPPGAMGTWVNGENDLGLDERLHRGRVEFMFRLRERGKVRVDYFESDRSGTRTLANDIVFGNQTFAAGQLSSTSLDWRQFDLTYTYSFLHTPWLETGTGIGIYFLQVGAIGQVPARNQRQEETAATPIPALPLDFAWRLSSRWAVTVHDAYLKATLNGFLGWYADLHEDLQYRVNPYFSLGLGHSAIRTHLTRRGGSFPGVFAMSISGPEAFVRFSY